MSQHNNFSFHLDNGNFARSAEAAVTKILSLKPSNTDDSRLGISGFPTTGRFLWLMPCADGEVAVIEAPADDPSPYGIISALCSRENWRWTRTTSDHYTKKVRGLSQQYNLQPPATAGCYKPLTFNFPKDWINKEGAQRDGMQIHCIVSSAIVPITKSFVGYGYGGALCSCTTKGNKNRTPASRGCAFVSRARYYDGLYFSDGLANSVFAASTDSDMSQSRPQKLFNFTDNNFNQEVFDSYGDDSMVTLLHAFTSIILDQLNVNR